MRVQIGLECGNKMKIDPHNILINVKLFEMEFNPDRIARALKNANVEF